MVSHEEDSATAHSSPSSRLPDELVRHLASLNAAELRAVMAYARSRLPSPPTARDLIEERPGEKIHEIEEDVGHTKVVKSEPCVDGCPDCPHGPYLYHVRVEPSLEDEEYSLHWEFLGRVTS